MKIGGIENGEEIMKIEKSVAQWRKYQRKNNGRNEKLEWRNEMKKMK